MDATSLYSTLIGGGFVLAGTILTSIINYIGNTYDDFKKECTVILSISNELKELRNAYYTSMSNLYNTLCENEYLNTYYTITQDFTTIYTNNAHNICYINDENLRSLIIKTYINLKQYIEELCFYRESLNDFLLHRKGFLSMLNPHLYIENCSSADLEYQVQHIITLFNNGILKNNVNSTIDLARVQVFLDSDKKEVEELILSSKYLKELFYTLVDNIDKIITLSNKYNNLKLPSILQQVGIRCLKLI